MEMSQVSTTTSALRDGSQHVLLSVFYNKYTIIKVTELVEVVEQMEHSLTILYIFKVVYVVWIFLGAHLVF